MYLSYEEYAQMGGRAEPDAFERLEARARHLIDRATHGRIKGEGEVREAVKNCAWELIEELCAQEELRDLGGGREISAMRNDGVQLSFFGESASGGAATVRQEAILRAWLDGEVSARGVRLLYAGVDG